MITRVPPARLLPDPGVPFCIYAVWEDSEGWGKGRSEGVRRISVANIPGGPLGEFAVGGRIAEQLATVYIDELPIATTLRLVQLDGHGEWLLEPLDLATAFDVPDLAYSGPRPRTLAALHEGEEAMLRESLGLRDDEPIPEPQGELPEHERSEQPYRFDPTAHMDLSLAEPAPPLPEPAAPGPEPLPHAQTEAPHEIPPPPARGLGSAIDLSEPFAH